MRLRILPAVLLAVLLAGLLAGACGSSGSSSSTGSSRSTGPAARIRAASLILDFTPNAVHSGIYSAVARGYDRQNRLRLKVIVPGASTDSIKLLESGRINFAILDIHDLAIAREHGAEIVGIMAIVQRPLAAVIAAPRFPTPTSLQGRTVGITGVPSDTAVLHSIIEGAAGNPHRVQIGRAHV